METTTFTVTGMTCGHCEHAVRTEVSALPGVTAVDVTAADGVLRVTTESPVDDATVIAAVDEAGYAATRA